MPLPAVQMLQTCWQQSSVSSDARPVASACSRREPRAVSSEVPPPHVLRSDNAAMLLLGAGALGHGCWSECSTSAGGLQDAYTVVIHTPVLQLFGCQPTGIAILGHLENLVPLQPLWTGTGRLPGTRSLDASRGTRSLDASRGTRSLDASRGTRSLDASRGTRSLDASRGTRSLDASRPNAYTICTVMWQ
ncbi:hypothetical protein NDU88_008160 [Pleurodeles waltl]|uniref:Uncharacterized protein n=1 Tax=Pleurodeles waltl TaxID=8319 RepID=A0AAV7N6E0_PLEWA|nr:hypothetical protein NDU88_008160 [Pleurodeles waltl]